METRQFLRIIDILFLMATVAWLISRPGWDSALAMLAAFIGYIKLEFDEYRESSKKTELSLEADRKRFLEFQEALPYEGSIRFIAETNMAGFSFDSSKLNQLHDFEHYWDNAEHEFMDTDLEWHRKELLRLASEYLHEIGRSTFPHHISGRQIVPPEWEHDDPERFVEVVDKLHGLAGQVVEVHQKLVRLGKSKLNI